MQAQIMSLEARLQSCHKTRHELEEYMEQALEELEKELAEANQTNATLLENLEKREEYIQDLEEKWQLRQQLQTVGQSLQPDYEAIRDRALAKLKMGKQSTAGKAIDAFIKELKHGL